jgi:hypothetical protein
LEANAGLGSCLFIHAKEAPINVIPMKRQGDSRNPIGERPARLN